MVQQKETMAGDPQAGYEGDNALRKLPARLKWSVLRSRLGSTAALSCITRNPPLLVHQFLTQWVDPTQWGWEKSQTASGRSLALEIPAFPFHQPLG